MMMQQQYPTMQAGAYARQPYGGAYYNMARPADPYQQAQQPQQAAYANPQYQSPGYNANAYYQPQYPMTNPVYQRPARVFETPAYDAGRGRGGFFPPRGRGGFVRDGFRGGRGGFRGRRKRPFVGGSLATQREWERQTACCFFLQGKCRFGDTCRFLHKTDASLKCQFGDHCRVHGPKAAEAAKTEKNAPATADDASKKQETPTTKPEVKQPETAKTEVPKTEAQQPAIAQSDAKKTTEAQQSATSQPSAEKAEEAAKE